MTATEPFVPPKLLADMITAAVAHRRSFIVQHCEDNGGNPFVDFTAKWVPAGCEVATELRITWHTRSTGTYRLFTRIAAGYRRGWHDITGKQAMRLLTGEDCFYAAQAA